MLGYLSNIIIIIIIIIIISLFSAVCKMNNIITTIAEDYMRSHIA